MERIICFDIETTSFDYKNGDRIIEIGAVEILGNKITDNHFHEYINPEGREIPKESFKIHNISNEFLKNKPTFKNIAPKFLEYLNGSKIVAHNGKGFDFPFINFELSKINLPNIKEEQQLDSILMARNRIWDIKNFTLDEIAKYFNVSLDKRKDGHGALIDSEILANVYLNLIKIKPQKTIKEKITEFHQKLLNMPKPNHNFPKRTFPISDEELKIHEEFLKKFM